MGASGHSWLSGEAGPSIPPTCCHWLEVAHGKCGRGTNMVTFSELQQEPLVNGTPCSRGSHSPGCQGGYGSSLGG